MSADYFQRMASYMDTMAQAQRILASAAAIDPFDTEDDRERRETNYRIAAQDYERMARQYREMAEREEQRTQPAA